ncbi:MAG: hypothetical protein KDA44_23810, partial [Planctomycetales bacterium]|nr:hypothetical protein [Planctomycetales bacterium]
MAKKKRAPAPRTKTAAEAKAPPAEPANPAAAKPATAPPTAAKPAAGKPAAAKSAAAKSAGAKSAGAKSAGAKSAAGKAAPAADAPRAAKAEQEPGANGDAPPAEEAVLTPEQEAEKRKYVAFAGLIEEASHRDPLPMNKAMYDDLIKQALRHGYDPVKRDFLIGQLTKHPFSPKLLWDLVRECDSGRLADPVEKAAQLQREMLAEGDDDFAYAWNRDTGQSLVGLFEHVIATARTEPLRPSEAYAVALGKIAFEAPSCHVGKSPRPLPWAGPSAWLSLHAMTAGATAKPPTSPPDGATATVCVNAPVDLLRAAMSQIKPDEYRGWAAWANDPRLPGGGGEETVHCALTPHRTALPFGMVATLLLADRRCRQLLERRRTLVLTDQFVEAIAWTQLGFAAVPLPSTPPDDRTLWSFARDLLFVASPPSFDGPVAIDLAAEPEAEEEVEPRIPRLDFRVVAAPLRLIPSAQPVADYADLLGRLQGLLSAPAPGSLALCGTWSPSPASRAAIDRGLKLQETA